MNAGLLRKMSDVFDDATHKASLYWPNSTINERQTFGIAAVIHAVLEWEEKVADIDYPGSCPTPRNFMAALKREAGL